MSIYLCTLGAKQFENMSSHSCGNSFLPQKTLNVEPQNAAYTRKGIKIAEYSSGM